MLAWQLNDASCVCVCVCVCVCRVCVHLCTAARVPHTAPALRTRIRCQRTRAGAEALCAPLAPFGARAADALVQHWLLHVSSDGGKGEL